MKKPKDLEQMSDWLGRQFIPNSIIALVKDRSQLDALNKYPFFDGKKVENNIQTKRNQCRQRATQCRACIRMQKLLLFSPYPFIRTVAKIPR